MSKKYLFLLAVILLLGSCNNELSRSLDFSNSNRSELERVLEHFKEDPNPLKYKAACFIIENMPYHYTYYGDRAEMQEYIRTLILVLKGKNWNRSELKESGV